MSNVDRYLSRMIGLLKEINEEHRALSALPFPSEVERRMKNRIESWVNGIVGVSVGHLAEFKSYRKYRTRGRVIPSNSPKHADVLVGQADDPFSKAIQLKQTTTSDHNEVVNRMIDAARQLSGTHTRTKKEIPRPGDRWVIEIGIWNPDNPWPFLNPSDLGTKTLSEVKFQGKSVVQNVLRQIALEATTLDSTPPIKAYLTDAAKLGPQPVKSIFPEKSGSTQYVYPAGPGRWNILNTIAVKIEYPLYYPLQGGLDWLRRIVFVGYLSNGAVNVTDAKAEVETYQDVEEMELYKV